VLVQHDPAMDAQWLAAAALLGLKIHRRASYQLALWLFWSIGSV
jgi:hypothetical protein